MKSLTKEHFGTIVKYIGISFITGGISHGFFSGTRSIVTSLIGVILFIIGNIILRKNESLYSILYYCGLAIGIGCLTGGLQHFPDSPDRSLIITPLGFLFSCVFFTLSENKLFSKSYWIYTIIGTVIVTILSVLAFLGFEKGIIPKGEIHGHNEVQINTISTGSTNLEKIPGDSNDGHTEHSH